MIDFFAKLISFIFNPYFLLLPIPYLLVVRETGDPIYALKWTFLSLFFVFVVILFVLYAIRKGYFSDLDVSKREQRFLWFLFVGIVGVFYLLSLIFFEGPVVLWIVAAGILFSVVVFTILNLRIKASLHVAAISSLIFAMSILYGGVFLLLLFLIPLIGWSRIRIKRHTLYETIVGALTGIAITLFFYIIFKVIMGISISL
jgi:membrane-associated phospholipid phosphatase